MAANIKTVEICNDKMKFFNFLSENNFPTIKSWRTKKVDISYPCVIKDNLGAGARTFYIGDPALAKQECQGLLQRKAQYDLDKDGVLDERELELAMEKEAKSRWTAVNTLFTTHPATYQRILLLREIGKEMASGQYSSNRIYAHV